MTVAAGDTLWAVASDVARPGEDVRDVVASIAALNDLGDHELRAGQQLLVPAALTARRLPRPAAAAGWDDGTGERDRAASAAGPVARDVGRRPRVQGGAARCTAHTVDTPTRA